MSPSEPRRGPRLPADLALWQLYPLFFFFVYLTHLTLLRLPYFWDEGGYYIPAAWDLFRNGTLIPQTTVTNAHPPLPSILLAAWWHLSGFVISGTRTFICMISSAALLAVFRLARNLTGACLSAAFITAILTALYPIWFAQSTLAHADIFAAAFTLWSLALYFDAPDLRYTTASRLSAENLVPQRLWTATLFSLSVLSKETAIVTPAALAAWHLFLSIRNRRVPTLLRTHVAWSLTLATPVLPLLCWYAYHYHRTGFVFGNPEFLRYNATANLSLYRIGLCLWHRLLHLTVHMNMFVATVSAIASLLTAANLESPPPLSRSTLRVIALILIANLFAFSILGGALLTRYLLPMYPLILLVCVSTWRHHLRLWWPVAVLTAAAFLTGLWVNPPYAFAPEDNLTYRDMIVLHQDAVHLIARRFPNATVLTAWPATSELTRPEIGYTAVPIRLSSLSIQNFSFDQLQRAAADQSAYDTALLFSTKWAPPPGTTDIGKPNRSADARFFDFHDDLTPIQAAAFLHGEIVWQAYRKGEWAAVLHFPRIVSASTTLAPAFVSR